MVDRYTPMYAETATDRYCHMLQSPTGSFVLASDYDALSADFLALKEQCAALESREVCSVAHDDVETCGYCQRDAAEARLDDTQYRLALALGAMKKQGVHIAEKWCWCNPSVTDYRHNREGRPTDSADRCEYYQTGKHADDGLGNCLGCGKALTDSGSAVEGER